MEGILPEIPPWGEIPPAEKAPLVTGSSPSGWVAETPGERGPHRPSSEQWVDRTIGGRGPQRSLSEQCVEKTIGDWGPQRWNWLTQNYFTLGVMEPARGLEPPTVARSVAVGTVAGLEWLLARSSRGDSRPPSKLPPNVGLRGDIPPAKAGPPGWGFKIWRLRKDVEPARGLEPPTCALQV